MAGEADRAAARRALARRPHRESLECPPPSGARWLIPGQALRSEHRPCRTAMRSGLEGGMARGGSGTGHRLCRQPGNSIFPPRVLPAGSSRQQSAWRTKSAAPGQRGRQPTPGRSRRAGSTASPARLPTAAYWSLVSGSSRQQADLTLTVTLYAWGARRSPPTRHFARLFGWKAIPASRAVPESSLPCAAVRSSSASATAGGRAFRLGVHFGRRGMA